MAKITYDDKILINENADIPAINKCQASDMNEIKDVVNDNYDEFLDKTEENIISANIAADETKTTTTTGVLPMELADVTGTKLTLESGQVKIGAGVSKVKISAEMMVQNNNTSVEIAWQPFVKYTPKGGSQTNIMTARGRVFPSDYDSKSMPSKLFSVNEGDLFQLGWFKIGTNSLTIKKGTATYMTIEVVE